MKLLFYINGIDGGGAGRVIVNLCSQFAKAGNSVILIISRDNQERDYPVDKLVKRIVLLKASEWESNILKKNILLLNRFRQIINTETPDAIISFMNEANFRSLIIPTDIPKIISIRNDPMKEYAGIRGKLTKLFFHRAKAIVCQTKDVKKWLPQNLRDRAWIIMNQVDPKFYTIKRERAEYYLATGRLCSQKNNALLINVFHRFLKKFPNEHLYIYGEGKLKKDLQNLINYNGDTNNIHLMGFGDNMPDVLSKAKCFILPSTYEGMPNGLLEALAAGIPCISTDCPCGGPRMIINNGENGILIPVDDENALLHFLTKMQENIQFAESLGVNAKRRAQQFAPEIIFQNWNECIKKVVCGK